MKLKSPFIIPTLCLIASALALSGCSKKQTETVAVETSLPVRVMAAESRTFENRIAVQGTIQAKVFANVAARVPGCLDSVSVDAGDVVVASKTELFQIDPVSLRNALIAAEQQWEVTKAALDVAEAAMEKAEAEAAKIVHDFERFERLHKDGRVSDNEFEQREVQNQQAKAGLAVAKAQVTLSQSQIEQAAASVAIARKNAEDSRGVAPISGVVTIRYREAGEHVGGGTPIVRIEDPSSLEVAAFLPAQYYDDVVLGTTQARLAINARDAGMCSISYRSPSINPTLRTFEIKGKVDSAKAVSGAMADLAIVLDSREGVGVPSAAVLVRGGKNIVFILDGGKATLREVTIGLTNDHWTEIRSGLTAGERVIVEGQTLLNDGSKVNLL